MNSSSNFLHKHAYNCLHSVFLLAIVLFSIHWLMFFFHRRNRSSPKTLWSNVSPTGLHTILLKQPFSALNIQRLGRGCFISFWKGCVRFLFSNFWLKTSYQKILLWIHLVEFFFWRVAPIFIREVCSLSPLWRSCVCLSWRRTWVSNVWTLKFINVQMIKAHNFKWWIKLHLLSL